MNYIIVTGYYADHDDTYRHNLFKTWWENTQRFTADDPPQDIYVVNSAGHYPDEKLGKWVELPGNLGHVCDCMAKGKWPFRHELCGWTMSTLVAALWGYMADVDMVIYKEQDCLAFGPWVRKIKEVMSDDVRFTTGRLANCEPFLAEQSLFAMRREFMIGFVRRYLDKKRPDWDLVPEMKFEQIINDLGPRYFQWLPFGYGRQRPVNWDDEVFYIQQAIAGRTILPTEFAEMKKRGLV